MRIGVAGAVAFVMIATAAQAQDVASAQDRTHAVAECAWSQLTSSQQNEMLMGGATERTNTVITIMLPAVPDGIETSAISEACAPGHTQVEEMVLVGLQWRAREESARRALQRIGRDPAVVDAVLAKVFPMRRLQMGDALACPGGGRINPDWDRSIAGAIRMMRDPTINRLVYSLTALAVYSRTAQEGVDRHLEGAAAPCPA